MRDDKVIAALNEAEVTWTRMNQRGVELSEGERTELELATNGEIYYAIQRMIATDRFQYMDIEDKKKELWAVVHHMRYAMKAMAHKLHKEGQRIVAANLLSPKTKRRMIQDPQNGRISVKDAASQIGMSQTSLQRLLDRGIIESLDPEDLDHYASRQAAVREFRKGNSDA